MAKGTRNERRWSRGYRELHNSWPSHNGAAQGCERADGMSFSFVSSRGDYFSFHSFVSCRYSSPFLPLCRTLSLSVSLWLTFYLLPRFSCSSFLTVVREPFFIRLSALSFAHAAVIGASRREVIILRMRAREQRKRIETRSKPSFPSLSLPCRFRETKRSGFPVECPNGPELICSRLIPATDHLGVFQTRRVLDLARRAR